LALLGVGVAWHLWWRFWELKKKDLRSRPSLQKLLIAAELDVLKTLKKKLSSVPTENRQKLLKIEERVNELEREL